MACRAANIAGIVRVSSADETHILSALDCGAAGILIPHVISAETATEVVACARFRGGKRGFSPSGRAGNYGGMGIWDYVDHCDSVTTVIGMIEDPEAVDAIDENELSAFEKEFESFTVKAISDPKQGNVALITIDSIATSDPKELKRIIQEKLNTYTFLYMLNITS